jgi:putative membrane protein
VNFSVSVAPLRSHSLGAIGILKKSSDNGGFMYFIIRLSINMVAILIIAYLLPKVIGVDSWLAALVAAFLLGVVNTFIRPLLILLTLPLTVVTFGVFLLVINGLLLWLVSAVVRGFHVNGFWGAVIGSILISVVSWILSGIARPFEEGTFF